MRSQHTRQTQYALREQVVNFSEDIRAQLYKIASIGLCSNLGGQIIMSLVMSPPKVRRSHVLAARGVIDSRVPQTVPHLLFSDGALLYLPDLKCCAAICRKYAIAAPADAAAMRIAGGRAVVQTVR